VRDFDPVTQDPPHGSGQNQLIDLPVNGGRLFGVEYHVDEARPTVLLLHGFPGLERNFDLAHMLRRAGWNTVVFHYRGAWGSVGDFAFRHVLEDTLSVVHHLLARETPVVLLGHSMGGWAALMAAAMETRITAVGTIAKWNIGALAAQIGEDDNSRETARSFLSGLATPLQGTSGAKLLDEMLAAGADHGFTMHRIALARLVLNWLDFFRL
jgi:hypothetical protein